MGRQFGLREGVQTQNLHASRQRVRQLWQQQDIGRTGQDETPWPAITINRCLQSREQFRNPLYFIQHHPIRQIGDKTDRIGLSRPAQHIVIETYVGIARRIPHHAGQRGLAALPGTVQQDNWSIGQSLG